MFRVKIVTIMGVVACVFSALGAASASANWFVGGTELKTSAILATAEVVDEIPVILVPSLNDLAATCSGGGTLNNSSPEIIAGNSVKAEALIFLGCNVTNPPTGCSLAKPNQAIPTLPITAHAFLGPGEEVRVIYLAQTKNTLAEIEFSESNECALTGRQILKGSITDGVPRGQLEATTETLVGLGSVENNSLEGGGGAKVKIVGGKALVKLASGSKWSFQ
jgi:hypothetical protein